MAFSRRPAQIADAVNRTLERLMPLLPPLGIALGFLLPGLFIRLRPAITVLFGLLTLSGALKLKAREFGRTLANPLPILLALVSMHAVMPLAARLAAALFFGNRADTAAGFVLLYAGPTAVSGFIWVSIFHGDSALCLTLILIDTILAPLVMPGTVRLLMGTGVAVDMTGIAVSLLFMVVIPTAAGVSANEASRGKIPALVCPFLAPLSKIILLAIIAANASPVLPQLRLDDPEVWAVAVLCVFLAAFSFALAKCAGAAGRLAPEKRVSLFFSGGLRNISAVTTIAVDFFAEGAALPALLGIVFQQTVAALMARLLLGRRTDSAQN